MAVMGLKKVGQMSGTGKYRKGVVMLRKFFGDTGTWWVLGSVSNVITLAMLLAGLNVMYFWMVRGHANETNSVVTRLLSDHSINSEGFFIAACTLLFLTVVMFTNYLTVLLLIGSALAVLFWRYRTHNGLEALVISGLQEDNCSFSHLHLFSVITIQTATYRIHIPSFAPGFFELLTRFSKDRAWVENQLRRHYGMPRKRRNGLRLMALSASILTLAVGVSLAFHELTSSDDPSIFFAVGGLLFCCYVAIQLFIPACTEYSYTPQGTLERRLFPLNPKGIARGSFDGEHVEIASGAVCLSIDSAKEVMCQWQVETPLPIFALLLEAPLGEFQIQGPEEMTQLT